MENVHPRVGRHVKISQLATIIPTTNSILAQVCAMPKKLPNNKTELAMDSAND